MNLEAEAAFHVLNRSFLIREIPEQPLAPEPRRLQTRDGPVFLSLVPQFVKAFTLWVLVSCIILHAIGAEAHAFVSVPEDDVIFFQRRARLPQLDQDPLQTRTTPHLPEARWKHKTRYVHFN